jgi:hypothetical protein
MGFKVENKNWIDRMLSEMETASIEANRADVDQEKAINQVGQKYFYPGMSKTDAFKLLKDLKSRGFHVSEYRHEGLRTWPDGEFKLFSTGDSKYYNIPPPGMNKFVARNQDYGRIYFVISKGASVVFFIRDGEENIRDVEAQAWLTGP